jgi:hypothetical protein
MDPEASILHNARAEFDQSLEAHVESMRRHPGPAVHFPKVHKSFGAQDRLVSGPDDSSVGGDYMKYRFILALLSLPGLANAGVTYQMTTQSFGRLAGGPFSSDYVMEGDKIRINASDGKTVFIFRDESIYVIDSVTRSAQVLRHAGVPVIVARLRAPRVHQTGTVRQRLAALRSERTPTSEHHRDSQDVRHDAGADPLTPEDEPPAARTRARDAASGV